MCNSSCIEPCPANMGASITDMSLARRDLQRSVHVRFGIEYAGKANIDLSPSHTPDMRLSDLLRLELEKSAFDKTPYKFLPRGALDSLITMNTILKEMNITRVTEQDRETAHYILAKAKRAFATAVYIDLPPEALYKAMTMFRLNGFADEHLPLDEMTGAQLGSNKVSGFNHPLVKMESHAQYEGMRVWTFRRVHAFLEEQFKFLAPVMSVSSVGHDFGNCILPFTKKHATRAEGAFGMVYKVEIHPDHLQKGDGQVREQSLKTVQLSDKLLECFFIEHLCRERVQVQ